MLCLLLGCAAPKMGAQPSNDAAGKDAGAATDTVATGDAPPDAAPTVDAP